MDIITIMAIVLFAVGIPTVYELIRSLVDDFREVQYIRKQEKHTILCMKKFHTYNNY